MKTSEKQESPLEGMTLQPDGSERKGGLKSYADPSPRPDITPPPIVGGACGGYGSGFNSHVCGNNYNTPEGVEKMIEKDAEKMKKSSQNLLDAAKALNKIGYAIEKIEMMSYEDIVIHCFFVGTRKEDVGGNIPPTKE